MDTEFLVFDPVVTAIIGGVLCAVLGAFVTVLFMIWWYEPRSKYRWNRNDKRSYYCVKCKYPLEGLPTQPGSRCPECGRQFI